MQCGSPGAISFTKLKEATSQPLPLPPREQRFLSHWGGPWFLQLPRGEWEANSVCIYMLIITLLWGTFCIFEYVFPPLGIAPCPVSFTEGTREQPPVPQITVSPVLFAEVQSNISTWLCRFKKKKSLKIIKKKLKMNSRSFFVLI